MWLFKEAFNFSYFLFAAFVCFLLPGLFFVSKLKLNAPPLIFGSLALGICLWAIQGYLFGFFNVRWITYIYLAFFTIFFVIKFKKSKKIISFIFKPDWIFLGIFSLGSLVMLSSIWFMGVKVENGMFFCCRGVPDAVYHLSLTESLIRGFPPKEPGISDLYLKNYHFFSNLVVADLSRVFGVDFIKLQFQYMSLLIITLIGGFAFYVSKLLNLGRSYSYILAIFLFFGGDILYLLFISQSQSLNLGFTLIDDASKLLAGPPRSFSIVILLWSIYFLIYWIKNRDLTSFIISAVMIGSLTGFKIYSAIFAISGLVTLNLFYLINKNPKPVLVSFLALTISAIYHFQFNFGAGGLSFNGYWRIQNFMQNEAIGLTGLYYLGVEKFSENYPLQGNLLNLFFLLIYLVFVLGTSNIAFYQSKKSLKRFPLELNVFLATALLISLILGLFSSQSISGANTIQFLITFIILSSFYSALALYHFLDIKSIFFKTILVLIVFFTSFRSFSETTQNIKSIWNKNSFLVSNQQLEAIKYLKKYVSKDEIIAVEPRISEDTENMYLSFLSEKNIYLIGGRILKDHGHEIDRRTFNNAFIFTNPESDKVKKMLYDNNIKYVYLTVAKDIIAKDSDFLTEVFVNNEVRILKVD